MLEQAAKIIQPRTSLGANRRHRARSPGQRGRWRDASARSPLLDSRRLRASCERALISFRVCTRPRVLRFTIGFRVHRVRHVSRNCLRTSGIQGTGRKQKPKNLNATRSGPLLAAPASDASGRALERARTIPTHLLLLVQSPPESRLITIRRASRPPIGRGASEAGANAPSEEVGEDKGEAAVRRQRDFEFGRARDAAHLCDCSGRRTLSVHAHGCHRDVDESGGASSVLCLRACVLRLEPLELVLSAARWADPGYPGTRCVYARLRHTQAVLT